MMCRLDKKINGALHIVICMTPVLLTILSNSSEVVTIDIVRVLHPGVTDGIVMMIWIMEC